MIDQTEIYLRLRARASADAKRGTLDCVNEAAAAIDADLLDQLSHRQAVKYYTHASVAPDALLRARRDGLAVDEFLWPARAGTGNLRYIVAASRMAGLDRGIYEVEDGGFRFLAPFAEGVDLGDMVLQPEFGDAAAVLLVVGSLRTAIDGRGDQGHRLLLARAGAVCEIAWLRVLARGYDASIFAGFLPSVLREHLGLDGYRETQLLALAVGQARTTLPDVSP